MTSGKPWVLRPTTLKPRGPREPAVVLKAMSPLISSRIDESSGRDDKDNDHCEPGGRKDGSESQRIEPQQVDKEAAQYGEYHQNDYD